MARVFKAAEREFRENAGRVDGFRLASDARMADFGAGISEAGSGASAASDSAGSATSGGVLGVSGGSSGELKFDVRRLGPGQRSSLYHFHRAAEELFMIVSGAATLRTPDGRQLLQAGDVAYFERGETGAHQLENHTAGECIYLDIRTFNGCDVAEYPDSDSVLLIPTMEKFRRAASIGYFDVGTPTADQQVCLGSKDVLK